MKPTGAAFLRAAASPPRDTFVQDIRIHWTVMSTASAFPAVSSQIARHARGAALNPRPATGRHGGPGASPDLPPPKTIGGLLTPVSAALP